MQIQTASTTMPPAVAGSFYPGAATELRDQLTAMLDEAARAFA